MSQSHKNIPSNSICSLSPREARLNRQRICLSSKTTVERQTRTSERRPGNTALGRKKTPFQKKKKKKNKHLKPSGNNNARSHLIRLPVRLRHGCRSSRGTMANRPGPRPRAVSPLPSPAALNNRQANPRLAAPTAGWSVGACAVPDARRKP